MKDAPNANGKSLAAGLARYARILVEVGAGLRRDQPLFILSEAAHREAALAVAAAGYAAGAGRVQIFTTDVREQAMLIRHGRLEEIEMAHAAEQRFFG